jgi:uncharacterized delta-60 repeat protein
MKKLTLITTIVAVHLTAVLFGQAGHLDSTFNDVGFLTAGYIHGDGANAVAIQSDGKIVAAGFVIIADNQYFMTVRWKPDGSLDSTYAGYYGFNVIYEAGGWHNYAAATSMALQTDGKIVIAGYTLAEWVGSHLHVLRLKTDGNVDTSFGGINGVTSAIGNHDEAYSIAIQPDGKIVVAGKLYNELFGNYDFALFRYNTNGSIDSTFSNDGIAITHLDSFNYATARSVAIQIDGKIVAAGSPDNSITGTGFMVVRYNPDGKPDSSFGVNGVVQTTSGCTNDVDLAQAVAIQPDGKIVVAGVSCLSQSSWAGKFAMVRFNPDGSMDPSFNSTGMVTTQIGLNAAANSMLIQPNGEIILSGGGSQDSIASNSNFTLARYKANGSIDSTFGDFGIVTTSFGYSAGINATAFQPDGKIIAAGSQSGAIAVARYISGLDVGVIDFSPVKNEVLVYPNPIARNATLVYTLNAPENITIELVDMNGRLFKTFTAKEPQQAGKHQQEIVLPESLPGGAYCIIVSSPNGRVSVRIVKP